MKQSTELVSDWRFVLHQQNGCSLVPLPAAPVASLPGPAAATASLAYRQAHVQRQQAQLLEGKPGPAVSEDGGGRGE